MQGIQRLRSADAGNQAKSLRDLLVLEENSGTMSARDYDKMIRDLVAYLVYMGEPASVKRVRVGAVVLIFLGLMVMLTWLLKREYWKDLD
ncbi:MAG: cytochrome c1, partial [Burkholderiales bacterium]|nr:cytochrome c1 [Burkholderiales bacterium]